MNLIDPELAAILRCPVDKGELAENLEESQLVCLVCDRHYPVRDGIPYMLIEETEGGHDE